MTEDEKMMCGTWRLEREIGRGAYGVVYLAVNATGDRAAVKVCRRDALDEAGYARELRGATLYRAIPTSTGLVRMRELAEMPWGFYAVMDLADDEFIGASAPLDAYRPRTLASVIEGEKALPLSECVTLARALAKGLVTLQRHHLLHRDVKPANVLYVDGDPVLSDFGLVVEEATATSHVGTPGYVPPETFTSSAGDVYSLGLLLKAASFGRRVEDLAKGPAQEADTLAPSFSAWWRILNKATAETPSMRYQSAKAFLKDLEFLALAMKARPVITWGVRIALAALVIGIVIYLVGPVASSIRRQTREERRVEKMREDTVSNVRTNLLPKISIDLKRTRENIRKVTEGASRAHEGSRK